MKNGKWIIGIIISLLVAYFVIFENDQQDLQELTPPTTSIETTLNVDFIQRVSNNPNKESVSKSDLGLAYQACRNFSERHATSQRNWLEHEMPSAQSLLNDGYSLDQVTASIEHLRNSNFAASFRVKYLRHNSTLSVSNKTMMDTVRAHMPDVFASDSGLSVSKKVPNRKLQNFNKLDKSKKITLLAEVSPNVDDLAYFMSQNEFSNDDILLMLDSLEEPAGIVGYEYNIEAISLVDFAVKYGRFEVVDYLLKNGLPLTEDAYLASTMEWALNRLYYTSVSQRDARNDAVKTVQLIADYGGRARFTEQTYENVEGSFPRQHYEFDAEIINHYMQEYGLNLTLIPSRQALEVNQDDELIKLLNKNKQDYVEEHLGITNFWLTLSDCRPILDGINGLWPWVAYETLLEKTKLSNPESPENVVPSLAAIDPFLVDYFQSKQKLDEPLIEYMSNVDSMFRPLRDDKILEVIDAFLALPLTKGQKRWVVIQILGYDSTYFAELKNSELMESEPLFSIYERFRQIDYANIKKLYEAGANLLGSDASGKTLLYYAVKRKDLQLLTFMQEENFPFHSAELGEDPLHFLLRDLAKARSYKTPQSKFDILDALMQFNPSIDEFHLKRMAVLEIVETDTFQLIIATHPALKPPLSTGLPNIRYSLD